MFGFSEIIYLRNNLINYLREELPADDTSIIIRGRLVSDKLVTAREIDMFTWRYTHTTSNFERGRVTRHGHRSTLALSYPLFRRAELVEKLNSAVLSVPLNKLTSSRDSRPSFGECRDQTAPGMPGVCESRERLNKVINHRVSLATRIESV